MLGQSGFQPALAVEAFLKTVLGAVGLISDDDHVAAVGEHRVGVTVLAGREFL